MGAFAVEALNDGQTQKMIGEIQGELVLTPLEQTSAQPNTVAQSLMNLLKDRAR